MSIGPNGPHAINPNGSSCIQLRRLSRYIHLILTKEYFVELFRNLKLRKTYLLFDVFYFFLINWNRWIVVGDFFLSWLFNRYRLYKSILKELITKNKFDLFFLNISSPAYKVLIRYEKFNKYSRIRYCSFSKYKLD